MNILYLIGNGFDLAQGLKTSYSDFYDYLKTKNPVNSVAALMQEQIKGSEVELWKDLELKLGEFTVDVRDKEQFEEFYYDLCDKLREYLIDKNDSFSPTKQLTEKYVRDMVSPYVYLSERDKVSYRNFFSTFKEDRVINIVSFNYTDVLDRAIDAYNPELELPTYGYRYRLSPIENVHGRLNTSYLLMGVNDESQILNPRFAEDENVWDYLVKPRSNAEIGTLIDTRVADTIMSSHLIVTMGLSYGETDSNWWRIIGSRLKSNNNVLIILFEHVKNLPVDPRKHQPICREKRKGFLLKCGIEESETSKYVNSVFVCLNQGMFNPNTYFYVDDRKGL